MVENEEAIMNIPMFLVMKPVMTKITLHGGDIAPKVKGKS